jgi:formylglycine-generating enzyme required for sulfatase activity
MVPIAMNFVLFGDCDAIGVGIGFGLLCVSVSAYYIAAEWRRKHEEVTEADLKRDLAAKGMFAEDIERILKATTPPANSVTDIDLPAFVITNRCTDAEQAYLDQLRRGPCPLGQGMNNYADLRGNRRRLADWTGWLAAIVSVTLTGCNRNTNTTAPPSGVPLHVDSAHTFFGSKAGDELEVMGVRLCWCPPGKFSMGSPPDEPERRPDESQVEVTLSKGFWTAKCETTQGQWKRVMAKLPGEPTVELPEADDLPVGNVNFAEAEEFCHRLAELGHESGELPMGWEFRLPTEAQWEYACRAGSQTATAFGDRLSSKQANFMGKPYNGAEPGPAIGRAAPVGSYAANAWGLHDMHGNTFEWCRDWYHAKLPGGTDPDLYAAKDTAAKNRDGTASRVRRGGAWTDDGWSCRSACRLRFEPDRRYDHIGFRVVALRP